MMLRRLLPLNLVLCVLDLLPGASAQIRSRRIPAWPQLPVHAPFTPRDLFPAVSAPQFRQIAGNIYEYDWIVPTGAGPYHSIGGHRVVQVVNGKLIPSHNAVLLAHGDAGNFNSDFMAGTYSPQSLPVYLARNGLTFGASTTAGRWCPLARPISPLCRTGACNGISMTSKPRSFLRALSVP